MFFGLSNYTIQKGITDLYGNDNNYNKIYLLRLSGSEGQSENEEEFNSRNSSEPSEKSNKVSDNLIINNDDKSNKSKNSSSDSESKEKNSINMNDNKIKEETKDINLKDNENIEKYMIEEDIKNQFQKKEYIQKIKEIPFLIIPFIFANFHRKYKNKWYFYLFILISIIPLILFISIKIILIRTTIDIEKIPINEQIISKLSFESIIPNKALNWVTFLLYFKEIQIIRTFFNHIYWSFFVKSYFTFTLISTFFILFFLYITETVIKFNIYNIILFGIVNLIIILLLMIICYSCCELPLKKLFKFFLKGKEIIYFDDDDEDEDEEELEEGEPLKDNCDED